MRFLISALFVSFGLCLSVASVQAQSVYVYDEAEGGVVDTSTGLVWVDVTDEIGLANYGFAVNNMPDLYTAWETENGPPHDDWRLPSVAEFQVASDHGLHDAMVASGEPDVDMFRWASDPKFKYRGKWYAYQFNVLTGQYRTSTITGVTYIILVRDSQP